jgi:hypothetical protein
MQKTVYAIIVLLFLNFFIGYASNVNFNWGSIPQEREIYLLEWGAGRAMVYSVADEECHLCGLPATLSAGNNEPDVSVCGQHADLVCGELSLSFLVGEPEAGYVLANFEPEYENGTLNVRMHGEGAGGYRKVDFLIDGSVVHSPTLLLNGSFDFVERMRAPAGKHTLSVMLSGKELYSGGVEIPGRHFPLETALLVFLSAGIPLLLWRTGSSLTLCSVSFAVLLVFGLVYHFALTDNFGLPSGVVPAAYSVLLLWVYRERQ